jgi:hypothetical protein
LAANVCRRDARHVAAGLRHGCRNAPKLTATRPVGGVAADEVSGSVDSFLLSTSPTAPCCARKRWLQQRVARLGAVDVAVVLSGHIPLPLDERKAFALLVNQPLELVLHVLALSGDLTKRLPKEAAAAWSGCSTAAAAARPQGTKHLTLSRGSIFVREHISGFTDEVCGLLLPNLFADKSICKVFLWLCVFSLCSTLLD